MVDTSIEFLWILSPTGDIYVQRVFDRRLARFDEQMFSNLLATVSIVSAKCFDSEVKDIQLGDKLIYVKCYEKFQVILSSKSLDKDESVYHLVEEVAEAFRIEYSEILEESSIFDSIDFDQFGPIIDMIFGLETYVYLEEQDEMLKILDGAIKGGFSEAQTIKAILDFLDTLNLYKLEILINNIGENIRPILENATGLSELQQKRYKKLIEQ